MNSIFNVGKGSSYYGRVEFIHSTSSRSGAFEASEDISLNIFLPRNIGTVSAFLNIYIMGKGTDVCVIFVRTA